MFLAVMAMIVATTWCAAMARVFGVENKDLAAWAQAVGSLVAVAAAIWAAHHATGAAERQRRAATRELIDGITAAATLAYISFRTVLHGIDVRNWALTCNAYQVVDQRTWLALRRFNEMAIERWPSAGLFNRSLAFEGTLDGFDAAVAYFKQRNTMYPNHANWADVDQSRADFETGYAGLMWLAGELRKSLA